MDDEENQTIKAAPVACPDCGCREITIEDNGRDMTPALTLLCEHCGSYFEIGDLSFKPQEST
jgi:predicted RNA-binding Zn-ribbon protein involved in translation (DUF1610 family)